MERKSAYNQKSNESTKKWRNSSQEVKKSTQHSNDKSASKRFILKKADKTELLELKTLIEERLENEN